MTEVPLRCRQCGWETTVDAEWIPAYGARVRCPHCQGLQSLRPPDAPSDEEAESWIEEPSDTPTALHEGEIPEGEESGRAEGEACRILRRWLEALRRDRPEPLTAQALFREHGEELAHLFSLWRETYPGEHATGAFRSQLLGVLDDIESDRPVAKPSESRDA